MALPSILVICPYDVTLKSLQRVKRHLSRELQDKVEIYDIKPNDFSHKVCIEKIKASSNTGFIIFLGHGRSDILYGSRGKKCNCYVDEETRIENPDDYYEQDSFIDETNYPIFKDKKVLSLSCSSNELAKKIVACGAKVFLGFGPLPTSEGEFSEQGVFASEHLVAAFKGEISSIIKESIVYAVNKGYTFDRLRSLIAFMASKRMRSHRFREGEKYREELIFQLAKMRAEMCVWGDGGLALID